MNMKNTPYLPVKMKKRQVTTTIDGIMAICSIKLQKEVKI